MHEGYLETVILQQQKGTVLPGLNTTTISDLPIALPPLTEQDSIVELVSTRCIAYDALTTEAERAIGLLQERRTALISAVVTGKIDVRHHGAA
jgi:type I restriction enzyme S subunit